MKVKTPKFIVSYPNVFKPKKNDLNDKMEYSVMCIFPPGTDLSTLHKAAETELEGKFGKDKTKWPKGLRSPFRKHEDRMKIDEETGKEFMPEPFKAGGYYLNVKSETKPGLVDQSVNTITEESGSFYPGCIAIASLNCYAYDQKVNKGVSFGLSNIQKVADGDPLSSRTRAEDDFAPVEGANTSDSMFS